ncbi:MAG: sugar ABC transporter ATP-binding protein [Phycisphaerales bacterium]|nr:sugar ABC transporter ATP-binding protein [Phycisphaerales bacterium]
MDAFLTCTGISKRFGQTQALSDASVFFRAGEVHALMGENGAGKSTLGKAIAGLHRPDTGAITLDGRRLKLGDVHDAFDAGVRIVHQELAQCPNLSVAENLCLHALPTRSGLVDRAAMNERANKLLVRLAPEIDVTAPLSTLAPGRRQIVQIASSLDDQNGTRKPKVVIFDEPTSSLSMAEADRLMAIVRQLASEGLLAVYVSHRMNEIFACCDRVTVLRDGRFVATSVIRQITEADLIGQMIGRTIDASRSHRRATPVPLTVPPMLEVRGLSSPGKLHAVSLAVRPGEVLGIGGLVGAGRSELLDAVFGLDKRARGSVNIDGRPLPVGGPNAGPKPAIAAGVGYVPEDRRLQGLFFQLGVDENIVSPLMHTLARLGLRSAGAERSLVTERLDRLRVKAASPRSLPGELSGGNQQKLLIARWLDRKTKVLLLDEPTRGIDVGTKAEIYRLVREAADAGLAVVLVSSEMPELLLLSDRMAVLCEGRLTGELTGDEMTQENILRLATAAQGRKAG